MTAQTPALSVAAIDAALAAATPRLDEGGRHLATAVLRLLAAGEPVGVPAAAAAAGMPASRAGQLLRSWPGVFWDDPGQVTGFWGLALAPMQHRIRRGAIDLHAGAPLTRCSSPGSSAACRSPPPTRSPARPSPTTSAATAPSRAPRTRTPCCRSCAPASRGMTT